MSPVTHLDARRLAVLADCHIHPGSGPDWTPAILQALAGVDLIITLGDMGETVGLERLEAIAPVLGVRGRDDADDPRTARALRTLQIGALRVGCVFDPTSHGLSTLADPFSPTADWTQRASELFDGPVRILLHGATHRASIAEIDGILVIDAGSALLPAEGSEASFVLLTVVGDKVEAEIVSPARATA
jgi:putative phosphoesterase